jgi:opacity protein-like surface antigen
MYIPNSQNVPLLEEKGDIKLNIGNKDLQVSYGISDHLGIMANGYYNKNEWSLTSETLDNQYLSKRLLIEGGLGYYTTFGENGRFEVYGGAGYGNVKYDYDLLDNGALIQSNTFGIDMMRIFLQPAIGLQTDNFGFAFSSRLVSVNFFNVDSIGYTQIELEEEGLNELEDNMFIFVEPALTLRFGIKYVQLQLQPYYNLQVSGPASINAKKLGFNLGLYLSIDEFFK